MKVGHALRATAWGVVGFVGGLLFFPSLAIAGLPPKTNLNQYAGLFLFPMLALTVIWFGWHARHLTTAFLSGGMGMLLGYCVVFGYILIGAP